MEAVVQAHHQDDGRVLHQGEQVGEGEDEEEEAWFMCLSEAQQDKLRHVALVWGVRLHT